MQGLSMPLLAPHVLFHSHFLMGDTPYMWDTSSVKWHDPFSQRDLSIPQVTQNASHMRAHVYAGCDAILVNISQKAIIAKIRKCGTISKIPRLDERAPGNGTFYLTRFSCVVSKWWVLTYHNVLFLGLAWFILYAHNPKIEFALAIT